MKLIAAIQTQAPATFADVQQQNVTYKNVNGEANTFHVFLHAKRDMKQKLITIQI